MRGVCIIMVTFQLNTTNSGKRTSFNLFLDMISFWNLSNKQTNKQTRVDSFKKVAWRYPCQTLLDAAHFSIFCG